MKETIELQLTNRADVDKFNTAMLIFIHILELLPEKESKMAALFLSSNPQYSFFKITSVCDMLLTNNIMLIEDKGLKNYIEEITRPLSFDIENTNDLFFCGFCLRFGINPTLDSIAVKIHKDYIKWNTNNNDDITFERGIK